MSNPTLTLYSKPGCVQCDASVRKLDKEGLNYTYVDIMQDDEALAKVKSLGYAQAPVITYGTEHWSGYRPDLIDQIAVTQQ